MKTKKSKQGWRKLYKKLIGSRIYNVDDAAKKLEVNSETILNWGKGGLELLRDTRPFLVKGSVLKAFLHKKVLSARSRCQPNEMYCMKCKSPKTPNPTSVTWIPHIGGRPFLSGNCKTCGTRMNMNASHQSALTFMANLVTAQEPQKRLGEHGNPYSNIDLERMQGDVE